MLMVPGVEDADFSSLDTHRLRRVADQRGGAGPQHRHVRRPLLAGLRADRDDRRGRQPGARGPRPRPARTATACARAASPGPASSCASSTPRRGPTCPPARSARSGSAAPQVMKGYWNNDAATAEAVDADGWFRSGDAGYLDDDGYLYIHDRVKDMIVSGGENVYPAEVENVLMGHPGIADVAVIGVPHEKWGETAKAIVVKAAGQRPRRRRRSSPSAASAWPASSARRASSSSTRCPATRAARSSRRTSARRTGRAASARSTDRACDQPSSRNLTLTSGSCPLRRGCQSAPVDFNLPPDLAAYLEELDEFIETVIKPLEQRGRQHPLLRPPAGGRPHRLGPWRAAQRGVGAAARPGPAAGRRGGSLPVRVPEGVRRPGRHQPRDGRSSASTSRRRGSGCTTTCRTSTRSSATTSACC